MGRRVIVRYQVLELFVEHASWPRAAGECCCGLDEVAAAHAGDAVKQLSAGERVKDRAISLAAPAAMRAAVSRREVTVPSIAQAASTGR
ncbi:hypothetical protein [Candidatus Poriferisodalis sp.]|uniref:hypothetical protein n=1 Tax=Candidatus Poriferisodalis sp. TaxID=3101277 RepID=UPI003B0250BD